MSHKRRQGRGRVFAISLDSLRAGITKENEFEEQIDWDRFVDRYVSIDPYGSTVFNKQSRRGNIILRISRNGHMRMSYLPPFRSVNKRMPKEIVIESTLGQEEALRIILKEVFDEKRDLIKGTEFPNSRNLSLMFVAALLPPDTQETKGVKR